MSKQPQPAPDSEFLKLVGTRIRQLRTVLELNQDVFADEIGMHRSYIGQLEGGRKDLRLSTVQRVAQRYGLDVHQLLDPSYVLQASQLRERQVSPDA